MSIKDNFISFIHGLQDEICAALEKTDGKATFLEDRWERPGGGGGKTRVIANGNVFEKGGVNTSVVHGELPEAMAQQFGVTNSQFMACGISLVLHPVNPFVPTVHANFRYFELYDQDGTLKDSWFGGGADLTPYYLQEEDGVHFHRTFKDACDPFGKELYPAYKKHCDEYFINKHRNNEARGIGGIFYDYLRPNAERTAEELLNFSKANGNAFLEAYLPLVEKTKNLPYTDAHKNWQAYRRGRYVEFNLVHDRGTLFGLKTNGRTESILMSLPPVARWEYDFHPAPGSPEAQLEEYLKPREWVKE
ncbi:oxygen-dependent coproporphyrinogen oxidase [Chitinophaga sp. CC14]|uniref:oxygen-dependent coproporphyrinogen oxidase n=1 Tax=Chitinophaga sp. CC14 TaxID=3029199 RepID=UPI003B7C7805